MPIDSAMRSQGGAWLPAFTQKYKDAQNCKPRREHLCPKCCRTLHGAFHFIFQPTARANFVDARGDVTVGLCLFFRCFCMGYTRWTSPRATQATAPLALDTQGEPPRTTALRKGPLLRVLLHELQAEILAFHRDAFPLGAVEANLRSVHFNRERDHFIEAAIEMCDHFIFAWRARDGPRDGPRDGARDELVMGS